MGCKAVRARTPTLVLGSELRARLFVLSKLSLPARTRGFTLIELLVVVALIAIASAVVSLSLRDPSSTRLEQEAARLAALLEAARSEARASGLPVSWEPGSDKEESGGFRFVGLPSSMDMPSGWLNEGVLADIKGARAVVLGPEPLIGPQRIALRLEGQSLMLTTDGLGPFVVDNEIPNQSTP
jgi:general secretion pathway protein H